MDVKKLKISILATLLSLFIVFLLVLHYSFNDGKITYMQYTVQPGDTLWDIAIQCDTRMDINETIFAIRKKNNIDPIIKPGQVILIPVTKDGVY